VNLLTPDPPYDEWERGDQTSPGYLDRPIVLDIFGGSNWTGKTAEDAGRHWLSFERKEEYIRTSEIRFLEEDTLQERLENGDPLNEFREE
jgi:site-specific DNA-methyltransferase (cytosine-N4-specific)